MSTDIHAHVIPEPYIRAIGHEVAEAKPSLQKNGSEWDLVYPSGRRSGPVPTGMFDVGARIEDMDRQGVRTQALSVPPFHFLYTLESKAAAVAARLHNDAMVDMARQHPGRFVVLATLPLQDAEASLDELRRLDSAEEVVGVQIGTNVAGRGLDHDYLGPVWRALNDAGLAVVLHPDNVAGGERMQDHYLHNFVGNPADSTLAAGALIFGGVLTRNPALRVALLHGGGFLPYQIGRWEHGWRVRPEPRRQLSVSPRELLRRFYFDTLTHDEDSLRFLLRRVGSDRLCLGSDYPFDMGQAEPVRAMEQALTDNSEVDAVLETTPRALLRRLSAG